MLPPSIPFRRAIAIVATATALAGCGGPRRASDWPLPNLDLESTRALTASAIDRENVAGLHVAWRFRFRAAPGDSGAFTATPTVAGGAVYVQDMRSNVFALDLKTGRLLWRRLFDATNPGPDGLAVQDGRVYGATDSSAFALDASNGRPALAPLPRHPDGAVRRHRPAGRRRSRLPQHGRPIRPTGRGVLYAPRRRHGPGPLEPPDDQGLLARPGRGRAAVGRGRHRASPVRTSSGGPRTRYPYGGSRSHPNGGAYAGEALYTDSLLDVDAQTGELRWYDQVTPHDVRDYDFQFPPILGSSGGREAVFGAGKAGTVIAWDRKTHDRIWQTEVGTHRNDRGPLPSHPVSVCPGLLGGVLTPMAYGAGRLYVPVVDLCMLGSAHGYEDLGSVDIAARGRGELVALDAATGRHVWARRLPEPDFGCATLADGVVFTSTFDGTVYALDARTGAVLWRASMRAGINSCPALASKWLLVGAGVPRDARSVLELTAFTTG